MRFNSKKIAFTYAGSVVGAGFLSGQELWQFFASYGYLGMLGFVLAIVLQAGLGYIILNYAFLTRVSEFDKLMVRKDNKPLKAFFVISEVVFIFGVVIIMYAGAGSLIESTFNLNSFWGSIIFATIIIIVAFLGINGIAKVLSMTIPVLTAITLIISILALKKYGYPSFTNVEVTGKTALMPNFVIALILFSVHNLFCSLGVLGPLGCMMKDSKSAFNGMTICSIFLVIIALSVLLPIYSAPEFSKADLPMLEIAKSISAPLFYVYSILLLIGMFGSALSHFVSIMEFSFYKIEFLNKKKYLLIIPASILAFVLSRFGFSKLISVLYPISGYIGIIGLVLIVINYIVVKKVRK
ncbi:MAG: hypothetical protein J6Q38_02875 [Clostridia bacterium]|nr:hypothetical protein [Clostridia bacterium]